jgi:cytochrome c peroxidase
LSYCTPATNEQANTGALAATGQTTEQAGSRPTQVKAAVARDLVHLLALVDAELLPLCRRPAAQPLPTDTLRLVFRRCRLAYKRVEPFTEYFLPATSRLVNGAPVAEVEVEETKLFEPAGVPSAGAPALPGPRSGRARLHRPP